MSRVCPICPEWVIRPMVSSGLLYRPCWEAMYISKKNSEGNAIGVSYFDFTGANRSKL